MRGIKVHKPKLNVKDANKLKGTNNNLQRPCHHHGKGLNFTTCEESKMFLQCQELCVNCLSCSPM